MDRLANTAYVFGEFELRPDDKLLLRHGKEIKLTPKGIAILSLLVTNRDRLVTKDQLMREIWGEDLHVEEANVPVQVRAIRRALNDTNESMIQTVHGEGYRFVAPVKERSNEVPKHGEKARTSIKRLGWIGLGLAALIVTAWLSLKNVYIRHSSEEQRLLALALDYERRGDDELALEALDKAIAVNPRFAQAYLEAAYIAYDLDQDDKAQVYLAKAKDQGDTENDSFRMKVEGLSLQLTGDQDKALETYQILADRFPADVEAQFYLADFALDLRRVDDVERAVRRCLAVEPNNPYCNMDQLASLLLRNDFDGVLDRFKYLADQRNQYPWFHEVAGEAWLGKGDAERATGEFQALVDARNKFHGTTHFRTGQELIADVALYRGNIKSAEQLIESALTTSESSAERADDLNYMARTLFLIGDDNGAKLRATEAVKASNAPLTYIEAARVLTALGDEAALDNISMDRMPDGRKLGGVTPETRDYMKGAFALRHGNVAEAIADLTDSYKIDDDFRTAFLLGQAQQRAAKWNDASETFRRIIDAKGAVLWQEGPLLWTLAHYELARCYLATGRTQDASPMFSEFLSLWSEADPGIAQVRDATQSLAKIKSHSHP